MIVGAAAVELHIHGSQSLKGKRGVVRGGAFSHAAMLVRSAYRLPISPPSYDFNTGFRVK